MTSEPTADTEADFRIAELERRLAEQETTHQARLIHAELKTHAMKAGMVDLDGLKLVDPSQIKLNPRGEVEGAERLMSELRRSKPWLFQSASSSSAAATPPSAPPVAKRATEMSLKEWQAARAEILRRR